MAPAPYNRRAMSLPSQSPGSAFTQWRTRVASARLLVVGDVMLDRYWFGDVERISPEAPVPVVRVRRTEERPGGAANVARNVAALGARATLLSVTGDDEAATRLSAMLDADRVRTRFLRDAAVETTVKMRVIGRQQQLLRVDFESPPSQATLALKLAEFEAELPRHGLVLLSDYDKGALAHVGPMIARSREAGLPVLVDPKGDDWEKYRGASLITPNRAELREVVGRWKDEADLAARALALREQLALDALLVTRSEEGMTLFDREGAFTIPALAREVFDVTGAGDTVIAAFGVMLAAGASRREAMEVANRAAGVVVGRLGTAVAMPDDLVDAP